MASFSALLLGRPSLIEGVSRIFDFAGALNKYNTTAMDVDADRRAIMADWRAIGRDIESAMQASQAKFEALQASQAKFEAQHALEALQGSKAGLQALRAELQSELKANERSVELIKGVLNSVGRLEEKKQKLSGAL